MTDCAHEDDVVAFVSGDLSPTEARALEVHLDRCVACRRLASSLARTTPGLTTPVAFQAGDLLGRYRLVERIGSGGMGDVWSASPVEDPSARVALKLLPRLDPDAVMLFKREFRAVADLSHPNLVALYQLGSAPCGESVVFFIAMELVDGVGFLDHVRGDERRLRSALRQIAAGLATLHAARHVHRDIKPSNVRVAHDGRLVILDFGLVASLSTEERRIAGTPAHRRPNSARVDRRRPPRTATRSASCCTKRSPGPGLCAHRPPRKGLPTSPPCASPCWSPIPRRAPISRRSPRSSAAWWVQTRR